MTNIEKITTEYDVQSHKAREIVELLKHLPYGYTSIIVERAKKNNIVISSQWVRNVKCFSKFDIRILNLLLEFAAQEKSKLIKEKKKLKELIP